MSKPTRLFVVLGTVAVIAAIVLTLTLSKPPSSAYHPLFTNVTAADASEIISYLEDQGIDFQLQETGKHGLTISVPADKVHTARLDLAAQGLPKGGVVGFEVLESMPLGATDFDRRMQYVRALQGELTRTIQNMKGVQDARVHISLPEQSLFVQNRVSPTAAVLLHLQSGQQPDPAQIRGIVHLVASSVEGLDASQVTVIDQMGRILSNMVGSETDGEMSLNASNNLSVQERFQTELQANVQSLLEQVFGPGNVVARVTAELDFNWQETERNLLQPVNEANGEGFVTRIQQLQEQFQGTGLAPTDPTGINLGYPNAIGINGDSNYTREETTTEYEYDRIVERIVVAPGAVRRLSVAVVINREMDAAELQEVNDLVASAIGLDPERQDQISVAGIPFDQSLLDTLRPTPEPETPAVPEEEQIPYVPIAIAVGGAIVLIGLILAWRRRNMMLREQREAERLAAILEASKQAEPEVIAVAEEEKPSKPLDVEELILGKARSHPEQVAQVVRTWLSEN